ncbi:hypothetical protein H4I95_05525 [Botrytis cinerea]
MASPDFRLPMAYSWFFLIIEPISTLAGAYYAYFQPHKYLLLTHAASSPTPPPTPSRSPATSPSHNSQTCISSSRSTKPSSSAAPRICASGKSSCLVCWWLISATCIASANWAGVFTGTCRVGIKWRGEIWDLCMWRPGCGLRF